MPHVCGSVHLCLHRNWLFCRPCVAPLSGGWYRELGLFCITRSASGHGWWLCFADSLSASTLIPHSVIRTPSAGRRGFVCTAPLPVTDRSDLRTAGPASFLWSHRDMSHATCNMLRRRYPQRCWSHAETRREADQLIETTSLCTRQPFQEDGTSPAWLCFAGPGTRPDLNWLCFEDSSILRPFIPYSELPPSRDLRLRFMI
jgi:hypothetical protein